MGFDMRKRIPIEVDKEALRKELEELKLHKKQVIKNVKEIENSIKDKVNAFEGRRDKFDEEWNEVWRQIDVIKRRINLQICYESYGCTTPFYGTDQYRGLSTNIKEDVLEAIKKTVGISKLMHSQIEEIARKIVEKRLHRSKKYQELIKKREELRASKLDGWSSIEKIRREAKEFDVKGQLYAINKRISEIEYILKNTEKYKKDDEKKELRLWALSNEGIEEIAKKLRSLRAKK